jgi:peptidoglycan/xylan/chitin deacetylase (PgdA/CDA1 family)
VTFTFDDGYDDHYLAAEIMSKYELAGTAYLMPRQINQKNYLTENQVRDLKEKYQWDLSSHHKIPILDFTYEELSKEMDFTKKYLENFDAHKEARHFAYPLGKQSRHSTLPLIRRKFDTARIAGGGAETLPPADWHMLRTFNVMPHISPRELMERVKKAEENGEWLILMFHYITEEENPVDPLAYNKDKFEEFCQLLDENTSLVLTINDVFKAFEQ